MQIGIDLGATKIESVLLDQNGSEVLRERNNTPKDYKETIISIGNIVKNIETKFNKNQIIKGIKIKELILVKSHFFVDVCI